MLSSIFSIFQVPAGRLQSGVGPSGLLPPPPLSDSQSGGSSGGVASVSRTCRVYATIREMPSKRGTTVCGGGTLRQKSIHMSENHQVEIRIINSHSSPKPLIFVLKYEGKNYINFVPARNTTSRGLRVAAYVHPHYATHSMPMYTNSR